MTLIFEYERWEIGQKTLDKKSMC